MGRASLQHLPLRSSLETCGRKGMVFGTLHLTVTGLHQSGPYYCYDIRTDASWGTILRVLHDMIHLVFTMAHIISYHEATETQRDWLDSHSQQSSCTSFLYCQWLLTSSYSLGETQSPSHSCWQGPSWPTSHTALQCHYFLPLPIPHSGCDELGSGLQMCYIFCCLRTFAHVSSACNHLSLTPWGRIITTQTLR